MTDALDIAARAFVEGDNNILSGVENRDPDTDAPRKILRRRKTNAQIRVLAASEARMDAIAEICRVLKHECNMRDLADDLWARFGYGHWR
jgi:hypothetical protein